MFEALVFPFFTSCLYLCPFFYGAVIYLLEKFIHDV